jgi:hypothetical protein
MMCSQYCNVCHSISQYNNVTVNWKAISYRGSIIEISIRFLCNINTVGFSDLKIIWDNRCLTLSLLMSYIWSSL